MAVANSAPALNDQDFEALASFVKSKIGLHLRSEKRMLVESRLTKRLKLLGLNSFDAYLTMLKSDAAEVELNALSQALTTNVTSFFREEHHFKSLRILAEQEFAPRLKRGDALRIWSAGCSTGAEPYSIAMVLREVLSDSAMRNVRILATDIDQAVLAKAKSAVYGARETENLSAEVLQRHFSSDPQGHRINQGLRDVVQFNPLNLIQPWPMRKSFSVIFCRNVVIYFDAPTQSTLWQRFLTQLEPGGHLFIGHSERLDSAALSAVTSAGVTSYKKSYAAGAAK